MEIEDNLQYSTPAPAPAMSLDETPTPDTPPWGILPAIGVWIASVLFILVIPTFFLLPYLAMQRPPITESEKIVEFAKSDPTSIFLQIVAIIPAHLFTVLIAWLVVTKRNKFSFRQTLGWEKGGFRWWYYGVLLVGFFAVAMIVGNFFPEQENDLVRILHSSRSAVYIVAFVATFTAPFVEEVVYRGVLYSAFQRTMGVPTAFLLVTFLFAVVHVPQYYPSYSTIFLLGLLSLLLTSIRVKTKNLLPCIILHTLFNGVQSFLLIIEPLTKSADVSEPAAVILHLIK